MTRGHSKADLVKQLRAEVARLDRNAEMMTASLTDKPNMRDEAIERAKNFRAQLTASVRLEDAYKLELTAIKENLVKTRVGRANLRRSVNNFVLKVRHASFIFVGAIRVIVESWNCFSKEAANKVMAKTGLVQKRMLFLLDMKFAGAFGRIRVNLVRNVVELF